MVELALTGWTPTQREGLALLLDDAQISAQWGSSSVSVPDGARDQTQRFIDFLADTTGDVRFEHVDAPPALDPDRVPRPPAGPDRVPRPPRRLPSSDAGEFSDVASPGLRLGGALIDGLLLSLVGGLLIAATGRTGAWIQIVLVACYQIGMVGLLGRTLGNMAVRTRVVSVEARGFPGLRAGFIRWLVPQAGLLLALALTWPQSFGFFWSVIVYAPILRRPSHRGLHDRAAGVMVLDDRLTPSKVAEIPEREPDHPSSD